MTDLHEEPRNEVGPPLRPLPLKNTGLRVVSGNVSWPIRRIWSDGFALAVGQQIRGLVDVFDGERHVFSCLACENGTEGGEQLFVIQQRNKGHVRAPRDFASEADFPAGALAAFEASRVGL